jgi:hypothetical protein
VAEPAQAPQPAAPSPTQDPSGATGATPANTPNQDAKAAPAADPKAPETSPVAEAVEQLRRVLPAIAENDRSLAQTVDRLVQESSDPLRVNQGSFQHELAYAVQDVERTKAGTLDLSGQARSEMNRLAASAPGLDNGAMQSLMSSTADLKDRGLVHDIRTRAIEIGQKVDQNTSAIRSQIDVLENRVRLAPKAEAEAPAQTSQPPQPDAFTQRDARADQPAAQTDARRNEDTARQAQNGRQFLDGAAAAPGSGFFRLFRGNGATTTPPWEPAPTPFGERLNAFEDKLRAGRDDIALRGAETSGRAALEALQAFRTGEGAVMLNRIRAAARSDPGGLAGVLSEMRAGGKFADLRQQFNNALADEKGVTAAYDRAASALARYGQDRVGAEQIIARRPDAANLSARFEAMDKEIGEAAGEIPSRRDGKTMIDDLSRRVAEMLQRAVDSVKHQFSRGASQTAAPSGPSPG